MNEIEKKWTMLAKNGTCLSLKKLRGQ